MSSLWEAILMDERHIAAASALVAGKSIEEVAKAAHRVPATIYKWAEEPDFRAVVLRGIHARALITVALWANGEADPKQGAAALAILKWMGVAKKVIVPDVKAVALGQDEEDLGEFSREQLERLEGGED